MQFRARKLSLGRDGTAAPVELRSLRPLTWCRKYLDNILTRAGPFTDPDAFAPGEMVMETLDRAKILCVEKNMNYAGTNVA